MFGQMPFAQKNYRDNSQRIMPAREEPVSQPQTQAQPAPQQTGYVSQAGKAARMAPADEGIQLGFGFGSQKKPEINFAREAASFAQKAQPAVKEEPEIQKSFQKEADYEPPFRPQVNKEMTINIPDFLKNRK